MTDIFLKPFALLFDPKLGCIAVFVHPWKRFPVNLDILLTVSKRWRVQYHPFVEKIAAYLFCCTKCDFFYCSGLVVEACSSRLTSTRVRTKILVAGILHSLYYALHCVSLKTFPAASVWRCTVLMIYCMWAPNFKAVYIVVTITASHSHCGC